MSKILFVCTANICRSPAAEAIARARTAGVGHQFASAGFLFDGRPIEPQMARSLQSIGIDPGPHQSVIIDLGYAAEADLILTMESRHVQDLAVMSPELLAKTLPLKEATERLRGRRIGVQEFLSELDGRSPMTYLDTRWDVEDPYKRSKRKYRKAVQEISGLVDDVLGSLSS